ncbi:PREDICTED: uncharacterized protein LOC108361127 [Rhagoletis zephyria]|uniref:uncharacterized protein LOC108361127 n=1 Tax=Rhagoletis zephyria TaxID=28612 RepID=UPI0008112B09|nr:PREDICTED: uncharacterized protein LOC108361127 [Rhagoletis zephyria]
MEDHKDIARGYVKGDKTKVDALWKELVVELNEHGPPQKDVSGWKKVWMDWKAFIRKKVAHNNSEARATGGGPFNKHVLTPTEDAIAQMCGIYTVVEGISGTQDFGVSSERNQEATSESSDEDAVPSTSRAAIAARSRRREPMVTDALKSNISEQTNAMNSLAEGLTENVEATKNVSSGISSLFEAVKQMTAALVEGNVENKRHHAQMERLRQEENKLKLKEIEIEELKMYLKNHSKRSS